MMEQQHRRPRLSITSGAEVRSRIAARLARARADALRIERLEQMLSTRHLMPEQLLAGRLNAILSICAALLVTNDIEAILQIVVREATVLFPGSSGALLFLVDDDERRLTLRAASGGSAPAYTVMRGQGLAGRAFLAPRAMLIAGPEIEMALDEIDATNLQVVQRLITPWPPTSALLAPLRIEGQRLGSLVLYGATSAHLFLPRDLQFIQSLSDLAAVAISAQRPPGR
jgi:two-component system NtrC family sensor kinase